MGVSTPSLRASTPLDGRKERTGRKEKDEEKKCERDRPIYPLSCTAAAPIFFHGEGLGCFRGKCGMMAHFYAPPALHCPISTHNFFGKFTVWSIITTGFFVLCFFFLVGRAVPYFNHVLRPSSVGLVWL